MFIVYCFFLFFFSLRSFVHSLFRSALARRCSPAHSQVGQPAGAHARSGRKLSRNFPLVAVARMCVRSPFPCFPRLRKFKIERSVSLRDRTRMDLLRQRSKLNWPPDWSVVCSIKSDNFNILALVKASWVCALNGRLKIAFA